MDTDPFAWRFSHATEDRGHRREGAKRRPFINDPEKPTSPPLNDADATDAAEADEDIQDDGQSI